VTTRCDFFFLYLTLESRFFFLWLFIFHLLLNYSSYFYTSSTTCNATTTYTQALKRHRPDGPMLLCGYLYKMWTLSRPGFFHLLYILFDRIIYRNLGGVDLILFSLNQSRASVSYRRPPYRGVDDFMYIVISFEFHSFKNRLHKQNKKKKEETGRGRQRFSGTDNTIFM
jgi:hypothetical protein